VRAAIDRDANHPHIPLQSLDLFVVELGAYGADRLQPELDFSPDPGHGICSGFDGAGANHGQPAEFVHCDRPVGIGLPGARGLRLGTRDAHEQADCDEAVSNDGWHI